MFRQLQQEQRIWASQNFGEQTTDIYCLGMIEKVGALARAVLSRKQGIRNTEDHDANIRHAIGDITIYLVGFCNCEEVDMSLFYISSSQIETTCWDCEDISECVTFLITHRRKFSVIELLAIIRGFCVVEAIDFEQTVKDTWRNVIKKRDWKTNPDCVTGEEAKRAIQESGFKLLGGSGEEGEL